MRARYRPVLRPRDCLSSLWLPGVVSPTTDVALLLQTLEKIERHFPAASKDGNGEGILTQRAVLEL